MPSPFPGMNPYLEQSDVWQDFHANFIARAQEALSGQIRPTYVMKIAVRLLLHELSADAADYGKYIYQNTPEPPLSPDEQAWARQFIRPTAGTRE